MFVSHYFKFVQFGGCQAAQKYCLSDHPPATGVFDQIKAWKVGQALIAQKNIEWLRSFEHMLQSAFGTVSSGQLGEAITLEQVLSRS